VTALFNSIEQVIVQLESQRDHHHQEATKISDAIDRLRRIVGDTPVPAPAVVKPTGVNGGNQPAPIATTAYHDDLLCDYRPMTLEGRAVRYLLVHGDQPQAKLCKFLRKTGSDSPPATVSRVVGQGMVQRAGIRGHSMLSLTPDWYEKAKQRWADKPKRVNQLIQDLPLSIFTPPAQMEAAAHTAPVTPAPVAQPEYSHEPATQNWVGTDPAGIVTCDSHVSQAS
jgi:hypothetical protein